MYKNDTSSHIRQNAKARSYTEMNVNLFQNYILEANNELDSQEHTSLFTKNMVNIKKHNSELNSIYDLWIHD
jgi:hypothetical protein